MSRNSHTKLEERIAAARPAELSAVEEALLLAKVSERHAARVVESPFSLLFLSHSKTMIPLVLIFALLFGAGGTVAASDSARPGDLLFPVDRAIEDLRFSLSGDEGKNELRIKFANERLAEFDDIADDEFDEELSGTLTEAEADIFTNETIVKLEAGDRKAVFSTSADTREEIIDAISDRYGFAEADIDAVLTIETEDRASRADDGVVSTQSRERLEEALDTLNDFVQKNREAASTSPEVLSALELIEERLLDRSTSFPEEIRVKVRDDRARYEVRGEDGERVRVEFKDGEIRIKTKGGDDDDDDEDGDDDNDDERDGVSTSLGFLEIEADVFTDKTVVVVELNDRKTTFTLASTTTRADVVDEVEDRFDLLAESEIEAALELEFEDEDDSDNDNDEDEDEDDGHRGHGGGDDDDEEDDD